MDLAEKNPRSNREDDPGRDVNGGGRTADHLLSHEDRGDARSDRSEQERERGAGAQSLLHERERDRDLFPFADVQGDPHDCRQGVRRRAGAASQEVRDRVLRKKRRAHGRDSHPEEKVRR